MLDFSHSLQSCGGVPPIWEGHGNEASLRIPMRLSRALAALSLGVASLVFAPCQRDSHRENAGIEEIAAALGRQRLVEPRLTGFDVYAPCSHLKDSKRLTPRAVCAPRPLPGTPEFKEVRKAASRLERSARRDPAEDGAQEEVAVARLVWSGGAKSVDAAVEALENAVEREPKNARFLSDLSAAYYVRAQEKDEPQDLVRALDAAARAKKADPDLLEARFNLALTLDRLYLSRMATDAWNEYRELDDVSGWGAEARARIEALTQPSTPERWEAALLELEAAALRGDGARVLQIVAIDPQAAREYAIENLLGRWGERALSGKAMEVDLDLRIAAALGEALLAFNGDRTVRGAVEAIERAKGDQRLLSSLARGHRAFREGMSKFRELAVGEAGIQFAEAREELYRGESPVYLWALGGLARVWAYDSHHDEAVATFESILSRCDKFPALCGWAHWGIGWVQIRQGHLAEVLSRFQAAEISYEEAQEAEGLAVIRDFLAENLFLLGQSAAGWQFRYQSLEVIASFPLSWRRHIALMDAARVAAEEGLLDAGLALQNEALRVAQEAKDHVRIAEAYRARSRVFLKAGRLEEARGDLENASRAAQLAPVGSPRRKLIADLQRATGEILLELDPEAARKPLTTAIETYREIKAPLNLAHACLARSRASRELGDDLRAEEDLRTALEIVEEPGLGIEEEDLKISYSESIQDIYDELILFHWNHRASPRDALAALERARGSGVAGVLERLPENVLVIEYAALKDRLLIWVLGRGHFSSFERSIPLAELEDGINAFVQGIQRKIEPNRLAKMSSNLYDQLIPPFMETQSGSQIIYFVPDKILHGLPFAALRNPQTGRFLLEDYAIAIAPSLQDLVKSGLNINSGAVSKVSSALLVGNPSFDQALFSGLADLSGAEAELQEVGSFFPRFLALAPQEATKPRLLAELDRFEVFAFAGHAVSNTNRPSRSYLVLAPSQEPPDAGLLFAEDIAEKRFHTLRLVVLSACTSVGPRSSRSAGLAGMARPFLKAGVRTVVGSLWEIDDGATTGFLPIFYRSLASGEPAAFALRQAQLGVLRNADGSLRDVAFWSAFEVVEVLLP